MADRFLVRKYTHPQDLHSYKSLTAAATQLDVQNRLQARKTREYKQGWQADAWAFRDSIGELSYATRFLSNCASRMRLYPAIYGIGEETDVPVPMKDAEPGTIDPHLKSISEELITVLGRGKYSVSNLLKHLSVQWVIPGEAFLLGREDAGEEEWTVRSSDEIVILNDKYYLRETPTDPQGINSWEELPPDVVLVRLWQPHPRFRELADSPLRPIMEECESLLIHRRVIRAIGRSRIAGRGLLLIPEEMSIKVPNEDDEDPESDPFFSQLANVLMAPIADEGVAAAVVPAVIRGPADMIKAVQHIDFAAKFDETSAKIREELVGVIASGLDLPKEVIMGVVDLNHWSAWQVEDNTFRHHIEPHVQELVEAVTGAYFRPALEDAGIPSQVARRCTLWYDPSELVTPPDQTSDAKDLYDRHAISAQALARTAGFGEEDMPSPEETVIRMLQNMRTPPANLVMAAVHQMFPNLTIPPIESSGTVPGVKPSGVDPGEAPPEAKEDPGGPDAPSPPAVSDEAPPAADEAPNRVPEPPLLSSGAPMPPNFRVSGEDTTDSCGTCKMFDAGVCWGYGNRPVEESDVCDSWTAETDAPEEVAVAAAAAPQFADLGQKLMLIDRDLRMQLQAAASAAVMRQLERAGARLRNKVAKDETLRTKISHKRDDRVSAYLGQELVASLGVADHQLISGDWDQMRTQFLETVASAQKRTIAALKSEGMRQEVADRCYEKLKASRQPAWEALALRLTEIAHEHLYSPNPNKSVREWGEINPHTIVPAGVVRHALSVAGGKKVAHMTAAADIEGGAVFQPVGQLTASEAVGDALGEEGVSAVSYRWVHGPSLKPFEPHLELDGVDFDSFTSDALANNGDFPDQPYYMPGDHDGCMCDFEQVLECGGVTAAGEEEPGMCGSTEDPSSRAFQESAIERYGEIEGNERLTETDSVAIESALRSRGQPSGTVLYRGMTLDSMPAKGHTIHETWASASTDLDQAAAYAEAGLKDSKVILAYPKGSTSLDVSKFAAVEEKEHLVGGVFKVVDVKPAYPTEPDSPMLARLEMVEKPWHPSDAYRQWQRSRAE